MHISSHEQRLIDNISTADAMPDTVDASVDVPADIETTDAVPDIGINATVLDTNTSKTVMPDIGDTTVVISADVHATNVVADIGTAGEVVDVTVVDVLADVDAANVYASDVPNAINSNVGSLYTA